jgi:general secretion pathway protein G
VKSRSVPTPRALIGAWTEVLRSRPPLATSTASPGFTIAELIAVTAIIAILAATALPLIRFGIRHNKEAELKTNLRSVGTAIDRYVDLRLKGVIKQPPKIGQDIYPTDFEELTKQIELVDGRKIVLLRERDTIDPMTAKPFRTLSSTDDQKSSSSKGDNVWDVRSGSSAIALDGRTRYSEW